MQKVPLPKAHKAWVRKPASRHGRLCSNEAGNKHRTRRASPFSQMALYFIFSSTGPKTQSAHELALQFVSGCLVQLARFSELDPFPGLMAPLPPWAPGDRKSTDKSGVVFSFIFLQVCPILGTRKMPGPRLVCPETYQGDRPGGGGGAGATGAPSSSSWCIALQFFTSPSRP